jgi:hypothetical protein
VMRLTAKRRAVCDRLTAAGATGFAPAIGGRQAGMKPQVRRYSLSSRKAPRPGRDSNGTSNVFPAAG